MRPLNNTDQAPPLAVPSEAGVDGSATRAAAWCGDEVMEPAEPLEDPWTTGDAEGDPTMQQPAEVRARGLCVRPETSKLCVVRGRTKLWNSCTDNGCVRMQPSAAASGKGGSGGSPEETSPTDTSEQPRWLERGKKSRRAEPGARCVRRQERRRRRLQQVGFPLYIKVSVHAIMDCIV